MALSTELYRKIFTEDTKLIEPRLFEELVLSAEQLNLPLEQMLVDQAKLSKSQYLDLLAKAFQVPVAVMKVNEYDTELLQTVPEKFASDNLVFPFDAQNGQMCVAMADPSNATLVEQVQQTVGRPVQVFVSTEDEIRRALILYDGDLKTRIQSIAEEAEARLSNPGPEEHGQHVSVTPLVEAIVEAAVLVGASDIHLEPYEHQMVVRFRVDGKLSSYAAIKPLVAAEVVIDMKVKANLKIDEKQEPQDGHYVYNIKGQPVNLRFSTLPSMWGEKVVIRLLMQATQLSGIANLGFLRSDLQIIQDHLSRPHGMVLVTGPTNSGKSTTLYACLQQIERNRFGAVNITTIEDPVEYSMAGITQVQANAQLSFADGLRAMLRQDPDIIMVGEIRDSETAELATRAALAGRLVFSTLHTNDAFTVIPRLVDIGVPPYLIASTLNLVIAQRLAKKLCVHCRKPYQPDAAALEELNTKHDLKAVIEQLEANRVLQNVDPNKPVFYRSDGCEECGHSGTRGRVGVYEVMPVTPQLQAAVYQQLDSTKIRDIALQAGAKTMFADGVAKVLMGLISFDELLAVAYE